MSRFVAYTGFALFASVTFAIFGSLAVMMASGAPTPLPLPGKVFIGGMMMLLWFGVCIPLFPEE